MPRSGRGAKRMPLTSENHRATDSDACLMPSCRENQTNDREHEKGKIFEEQSTINPRQVSPLRQPNCFPKLDESLETSLVTRDRRVCGGAGTRERAYRGMIRRGRSPLARGEKIPLSGERNPKFPLYAWPKLAAGDQPLSAPGKKVRSTP